MIDADQIPPEVEAVLKAACDSGQPWSVRDTLAAALNAWPEMECRPTFGPRRIILPLPHEPQP